MIRNLKKIFSKRRIPSTETHSTRPSSQSAGETSNLMSSSNAASGMEVALLNESSETNPVPQSINRTPSSADQPPRRADPALNNTDKILSALQAVAGMLLPLGLPEIAKSASQLLTIFETKRRNDSEVEKLVVITQDISTIILDFVKPLEENPAETIQQKQVINKVSSYLQTLQDFCNEYGQQSSLSRFISSPAWKDKIDGISRGVQTQLQLINTAAVLEVLNRFNSPHETSQDQAFRDAEFASDFEGNINNFSQHGLDQRGPIPLNSGSSHAFHRTKFRGKVNITNHSQHFATPAGNIAS